VGEVGQTRFNLANWPERDGDQTKA
jgi:hypothetical protein